VADHVRLTGPEFRKTESVAEQLMEIRHGAAVYAAGRRTANQE